MSKIESVVAFMEQIAADPSHGYDQAHRNGPNYDCSSLVGTALHNAGYNVSKSSTTRNLRQQLLACGFRDIACSARQRGDIFLKEGHHVVMCVDESNIVHASINESGRTTGGRSGDQTGKEICTRSFYNYSGGWDYHFRAPDSVATSQQPAQSNAPGAPAYQVGTTYTLQTELRVRTGPGTNYSAKAHGQLSADAQKHDPDKDGALAAGVRVTCKEVRQVGNDIWLRSPSGWLAAYYQGKTFIA